MSMNREAARIARRLEAERAAFAAYEATRDVARAAWLERGGVKGEPLYEAARRAAWGVYEDACTASFYDLD